jgi:hypothetical protein
MTWSPPSPVPEAPTAFPEPRADPTGDSLRTPGSIQGNIIAGFNKDFQSLLFLQVQDRAGGLDWLAELRPRVATTAQVATFNKQFSESGSDPQHLAGVWVNVSFTAEGLELLAPGLRASLQVEGIDDGVQLPGLERRRSSLVILEGPLPITGYSAGTVSTFTWSLRLPQIALRT